MIGRAYHVVQKGWGREDWIANGPSYCGKLLHFEPGKRCSMHYHERKHETLHVISGTIFMDFQQGEEVGRSWMEAGETITIQPYQRHRMEAGMQGAVIMEVSTQHFEDDSVRVERGD